jgi:hypothetical protein
MDEQFAHDGGEGDFGWFALVTEMVVKLSQGGLLHSGEDHGTHIESVAHVGATTADMTLALPRSALTGPGSQASQGGGLLAVKLSQLRHVAQDGDGGDKADAGHLIQNVDLFLMRGGTSHQPGQFFFHGFNLGIQLFTELGLLFKDETVGGVFALLADTHPLLFELSAPIHQRPHLPQGRIGFGGGRRFMSLSESGEQSAVQRIAFGADALGQSEMTDVTGIEDRDRPIGGLERGDNATFIATGGFADDLNLRTGLQKVQQFFMAVSGVGQGILAALEVELEGGLGDVQAGVDGGSVFGHNRKSCSAHSCTYERVAHATAQSTVRVTDNRHERLWLPRERVQTVQEGNEHARAAALRPAGRRAAPSCLAYSQTRKRNETYKRAGVRWCSGNKGAKP